MSPYISVRPACFAAAIAAVSCSMPLASVRSNFSSSAEIVSATRSRAAVSS